MRTTLLCSTLMLALAAGCGPRFGTVEGVVSVDGKPANNGSVIFSGADNRSASGTIGPDGAYVAENVPVGAVKVTILQMVGGPARPGPLKGPWSNEPEPPPRPARRVLIPKKYQNVETSGLSYTVTGGTNEIDIALSSR